MLAAAALLALAPLPSQAQPYGSQAQAEARAARDRAAQNAYGQPQGYGSGRIEDSWDDRPQTLTPSQRRKRNRTGDKVAGCVMGGVLGGLLGAAVSNRQNRGAAIATGAAIGCAAGFAFAANWSERDRAALDEETQEVFHQPQATREVWTAPDSREQVTLTSTQPVVETQRVDFEHLETVEAPTPGAQVISRPYRTTDVLRLRSSPDTNSDGNIIGRYERGEVVEVIGSSADGRWAMIGFDGVIVGYSSFDYLESLPDVATLRNVSTSRPKSEGRQVASATPRQTSQARAQTGQRAQAQATAAPRVKTTKVVASTRCKSLVAVSGQQTDRKKGCAQPTGDWKFA